MTQPLQGIRIVDCSAVVSGPMAATILADQGASVVKVEQPGVGDILRYVGSHRGGMSGLFHVVNRGKRSLALDLRAERGRDILLQLLEDADVFIQNFRPGVVERMGLGPDELCAAHPRLVYVSIRGFGAQGPLSQQRVYDNVIQACAGIASAQSDDSGEPRLVRQLLCDKLTSITTAQAISAALFQRERTGQGQALELSMLDTAIAFLWPDAAADHTLLGDHVAHQPTIGSAYRLLEVADGHATLTMLSDAEFQGMCRALGLDEAAADPRFASVADRMQNLADLSALMQEAVPRAARSLTRAEIEARLVAEDVPCGAVRSLDELHEDPQVVANGTLVESEHPLCGRLREPRPAARFGSEPGEPAGPAPALGADTDAILQELGLGDAIRGLREDGVVA
jgi:crotonobetainyl-CoA:carnitine CoA-transferase CaiB-like acyl-CoA transferase